MTSPGEIDRRLSEAEDSDTPESGIGIGFDHPDGSLVDGEGNPIGEAATDGTLFVFPIESLDSEGSS